MPSRLAALGRFLPVGTGINRPNLAVGDRNCQIQAGPLYRSQFLDGDSGKVVAQVVRKGTGKPLSNDSQVMKAEDVKSVIDGWASDLHQSYLKLKKG